MRNWLFGKGKMLFKKDAVKVIRKDCVVGSSVQIGFDCKCNKHQGWLSAEQVSEPCPHCGTIYVCHYKDYGLHVKAV